MLRTPRRLPQRYNRTITPQTRRLVERRHQHQKQYAWKQWLRSWHRVQRRLETLRSLFVRFSLFIVGGIVLLIIGLALFSPILQVREIRIARNDPRIDVEQIQHALAPLFGQRLFFLTSPEVVSLLHAAVPDLESATVSKQYPSTLGVRVQLYPIIARLTIDQPNASATSASGAVVQAGSGVVRNGSDYLTSEGMYVVYTPGQVQTGSGLSLLRITDWGVRPQPGTQLVDPALLLLMRKAEEAITQQFGQQVKSRSVYQRAREFHLQTSTYALWFDLKSPLADQLQRYRTFLQALGATAAKSYIDLRLTDKVVYK